MPSAPSPPWPPGFDRIPDAPWTHADVDAMALNYDTVERHGWYSNLDPVVDALDAHLPQSGLWVDYSGGTGILIDRALGRFGARGVGVVNVDSSPKFLRVCLEKFRDDARVAFRRLRYLKDEERLERVDEVLDDALIGRVDALTSTNAVHLYDDLDETLASWHRVLRGGGRVFVNSGNIASGSGADSAWIIDDTVHAVERAAREIVREDDAFAPWRNAFEDKDRLAAHDAFRKRVFLPPRPLSHYTRAFEDAGFTILDVHREAVHARTREWLDFLGVYHDAILGWVGGSPKVEGIEPPEDAVRARERLLARAVDRVFGGADTFEATWTYVTCRKT